MFIVQATGVSGGGWNRTLNLGIKRREFTMQLPLATNATYTHIHTHTHTHTHTHIHTQTHILTHMHAHVHTHTHTLPPHTLYTKNDMLP